MLRGDKIPKVYLQIVSVIKNEANDADKTSSNSKYRITVSDGSRHCRILLASSISYMYETGDLEDFCIIEIDRVVPSKTKTSPGNLPGGNDLLLLFSFKVVAKGALVGREIKLAEKENQNGAAAANAARSNMNQRPVQAQPQPQHNDSSFTANQLTIPIEGLSPYHNKWCIKARVTAKGPIRTWSNAKGEGQLFSFDVCDETSEIRFTAFRDMVDKFHPMIEVDKVYFISKGQIKPANKQYSKLKNDYEVTINSDTTIQECTDNVDSIPQMRYNFVPIAELDQQAPNSVVDIIAICKEASEAVRLTAKTTGRELIKRDVTLVDSSGASIVYTMWGDEAENFEMRGNPVIALKSVTVKEYQGGKTLGSSGSTSMKVNPDIPEGIRVQGWFESNAQNISNFAQLSAKTGAGGGSTDWVTFHEAKELKLGSNQEKADYFQTVGMVHAIRQSNMTYKACPKPDCNKKIVDNGDGTYRCDKCSADTHDFKNRLLCNVLFGDWTSNRWVTLFADVAEKVLQKNGDEIADLENGDKAAAENYFNDLQFRPMQMKIRTKIETYAVSLNN